MKRFATGLLDRLTDSTNRGVTAIARRHVIRASLAIAATLSALALVACGGDDNATDAASAPEQASAGESAAVAP